MLRKSWPRHILPFTFILYQQLYLCVTSHAFSCLVLSYLSSLLTFTSKPANVNIGRDQGTPRHRGWRTLKDTRFSSRLSSTIYKLVLRRRRPTFSRHTTAACTGSKEPNRLNTISPLSPTPWHTSLSPPNTSSCLHTLAGVLLTHDRSIVPRQPSHRSLRWIWTLQSPTLQRRATEITSYDCIWDGSMSGREALTRVLRVWAGVPSGYVLRQQVFEI